MPFCRCVQLGTADVRVAAVGYGKEERAMNLIVILIILLLLFGGGSTPCGSIPSLSIGELESGIA